MPPTHDPEAKDAKGLQYTEEQRPPPPSYTASASSTTTFRQSTKADSLSRSLTSLPFELLGNIINLLDPVSKRCLSITNRRFRSMSYGNEEKLTRCGKWLFMAHLEQDFLTSLRLDSNTSTRRKSSLPFGPSMKIPFMKSSSTSPKNPTRLICSLCKTKHGPESFLKGGPRAEGIHPKTKRDLLTQNSLQRICAWHYGKLVCIVGHKPYADTAFYGRWVTKLRDMCMHCGQIESYGECHCREPTLLNGMEVPAACEICPRVKMRVYERMRKEGDQTEISWNFKTNKDGTLFVLEERTGLGSKCMICALSGSLVYSLTLMLLKLKRHPFICRWSTVKGYLGAANGR